jgi:hypothetical protein
MGVTEFYGARTDTKTTIAAERLAGDCRLNGGTGWSEIRKELLLLGVKVSAGADWRRWRNLG